MSAATLLLLALFSFFLGYRFYAKYLSQKIFKIDQENSKTPAYEFSDNQDYVPTDENVLWGHHFSSIAGAAPIVGPAVAIIWGWVPSLIWIVLGTIFIGAAHDFGALIVSMKHKGESLAKISGELISKRVRNLFLIVVLFLVWMVIAVFTLVIANLFIQFPSSVLPINFEIIVALYIGYFINRKKKKILIPAIMAQIILFIMIYLGTLFPIDLSYSFSSPMTLWILFLLTYSFIASTLPVWALLQPRDYINSHQLIIGLFAIITGLIIVQPQVVAPAFQPNPNGAPPWFPFLFITIACGAVSGFHGLVSAGTTSKQVKKWSHTKSIGYGSMIGEGVLAILATLAVSSGFADSSAWHAHYASWDSANGLSAAMNGFVIGCSTFLSGLGLSTSFSQTMISVLIISFAATSLDTATRIQRYVISEIGEINNISILKSPFVSAGIAVLSALFLMLIQDGGKGGLMLWPLFGAANQMLASLTLIIICAFIIRKKGNPKPYLIPLFFVFTITLIGLVMNAKDFFIEKNYLLTVLALLFLMTQVWIALETWIVFRKNDP